MTLQLLGRNDELANLQRELAGLLEDGGSRLVLIRGEPGIGKSALLRAFIDSAPQVPAGRPVLIGYGQSMTNSLGSDAFQAIRECLRSLMSVAERSTSRDALTRVANAFKVNAPDWLESVPMVGQLLAAGVRTGQTLPVPLGQGLRVPDDRVVERGLTLGRRHRLQLLIGQELAHAAHLRIHRPPVSLAAGTVSHGDLRTPSPSRRGRAETHGKLSRATCGGCHTS